MSDAGTLPIRFQSGVFISTYGCQMNVNDSERMYSLLETKNYTPVPDPEDADLIIINSCSVREKPVHKVFSEVGRYRKLKRANPRLKIGVGGCVGQQEKQKLLKEIPLLDFVFGPDNIDELPGIVDRLVEQGTPLMAAKFKHREPYETTTLIRNASVTAFVNIAKGCDNFCTFCVVPFTRGRERSRKLDEIVADVKSLADRGVKEVTLLGQNVNSYKSPCDQGLDFADLLEALAKESGLKRIRYTTSHPKDFDEKLAKVMHRYRDTLCEYIHLPFQSGSSSVLERMNRGYTKQDYLNRVEMIKSHVPGVSWSTDIIVGFPGETEEDFQETLDVVEKVGFDSIYAFKYSPRPLTKAAQFSDQIEEKVKEERLARLFEFHRKLSDESAKAWMGRRVQVLVEGFEEKRGNWVGRSSQNRLVHFKGQAHENLTGELLEVEVIEPFPQVLRAKR